MRCLMLLRHAKAIPADGHIRDPDRPLEARGRDDAVKMGAYMARHGLVPDQVVVSTAKRTQETWELAAPAFSRPPPVVFEGRLYNATPEAILGVIKEHGSSHPSLLVIGHNPGMHQVATLLVAAGDVEARERLHEALPTSGLVTIDFPFDDWNKLHPHAWRLGHFVTPRSLVMATD
jgi:phosphohistidine phosphatase